MGLDSWLEWLDDTCNAWSRADGASIYSSHELNEAVDFAAAFDQDDMAADMLLEIRQRQAWAAADLLPLAPVRPYSSEPPVRLLLHTAIFDTRSEYFTDAAEHLYRDHFKPASDPHALHGGSGCCCCCCGWCHKRNKSNAQAYAPSQDVGQETLAPHTMQLPAGSSQRLPAAPYQHLVWTVEPGEVEAAVQLLKWCYSKQLSPEALASPLLLSAVYHFSEKFHEYYCRCDCIKASATIHDLSPADEAMFKLKRAEAAKDPHFKAGLIKYPRNFTSTRRYRDVIVELRALPPSGSQTSSSTGRARASSLNMHGLVMMTGSPYFKARLNAAAAGDGCWAPEPAAAAADARLLPQLRDWTHRRLGGKERRRRLVLVEHVEEGELEPALAVLRSLYGWKALPDAITSAPLTLLRTLLLAGRFQVARCTPLCLAALAKLPLEAWDADAMAQLLELPEEVTAGATSPELSLAALQARARNGIAEQYGNLPAVEAAGPNGQLYLQFMGLPFSAVQVVLPSGGGAKGTAQQRSCLAAAWLAGEQGRGCSPEQRSVLELQCAAP